jgi:glycosyltransferase involved in cell wall biosynthesis
LICTPPCAEKLGRDLPEDVTLFSLSFERPYQIFEAARFGNILRREKISILHSHLFNASLAASLVGRLSGVPAIIETTHVREAWRHGWLKGSYAIDRFAGRFVDHYIAVSKANARYLIEEKQLPAKKVHVIHNGCDLKKFDPERKVPQGLKKSLGFSEDDLVVVVLGRLEPQKGHRFLLQAHARVLREVPTVRLVCVGAGALDQELQDQCQQLQIQDSVRFVGYQSNVEDWLALADISVLPSLFEGLPLVAIESLAAQRCMVATAVDGTPEVVINERTGLTVPAENAQKLADALVRLLRQPELRQRLARAGRQWVLDHFSQEQQVRKTEELYLRAWETSRAVKRNGVAENTHQHAALDCERATPVEPPVGDTKKPMSGPPELARKPTHPSGALPDSIQLRETICGVVQRECRRCFSGLLKALISTGSLARDEATIIRTEESWVVRGDAEFMLVFEKSAALPAAAALGGARRRIENDLLQQKIKCKIDLSAVHPTYFQRLPAHIFTYELKHCGRVIAGDEAILQPIPDYAAAELSREDAWRLLCNRLIEVLDSTEELSGEHGQFSPELQYRIVKLYLDMATSLLVFVGAYAPSYRERRDAMLRLADRKIPSEAFPFVLGGFADLVAACTAEKLVPQGHDERRVDLSRRTAMQTAHALWRWELAQLVGTKSMGNDRDLFDQWMRVQPSWKRVRGWLYIVRACGWQRSYHFWPRWWGLRKASPRHWVYLVASSLLFQATEDVNSSQTCRADANWATLSRYLPVAKMTANQPASTSWKDVAHDVVWNYRKFLTGTRA